MLDQLDREYMPTHVGIIMDGNGRWAKKRMMPRNFGHKQGVETLKKITEECSNLGIKYLTVYAFSTENWKRSGLEISGIMNLLVDYLAKELRNLHEKNVKLMTIGDIEKLPKAAYDKLVESKEFTKDNTGLVLTVALNDGSRRDISHAIKKIILSDRESPIDLDKVDDTFLRDFLDTAFLPDPDLIIRPSGEQRLSNFLMWEAAYTEFWYSDINWPDFKKEDLHRALHDFQNRNRRYGGTK